MHDFSEDLIVDLSHLYCQVQSTPFSQEAFAEAYFFPSQRYVSPPDEGLTCSFLRLLNMV